MGDICETSPFPSLNPTQIALGQLTDVTLSVPANGEVLAYNSGSSMWENTVVVTTDQLLKISAADTTSGFGEDKIIAGTNIVINKLNGGGNEQLEIEVTGIITTIGGLADVTITAPSNGEILEYNAGVWVNVAKPIDEYVKVSAADTTPGRLDTKVVAGANVALNILSPGANEQLEISLTGLVSALDDLSDVTITAPSNGQLLTYTGAGWENVALGVTQTWNIVGSETEPVALGAVIPNADGVQDLGKDARRWKDLYLSSLIDYASDLEFVNSASTVFTIDTAGNLLMKNDKKLQWENNISSVTDYWQIFTDSSDNLNFVGNTASIMYMDSSTGFVGIGETDPGYTLDVGARMRVRGDSALAGGVFFSESTAPTTDLSYVGRGGDGDLWTGIRNAQTNDWLLTTFDNGNVLISPQASPTDPVERLSVDGAIVLGASSADTQGAIRWTGTDFEGNTDGTPGGWNSLGAAGSLSSLSDVSLTAPANTEVLTYNGSSWVNGFIAFGTLSDVSTAGATNGQTMVYNGATWEPGSFDLDGLTDVVINAPIAGHVLEYDGADWVNVAGTTTFTGLTDTPGSYAGQTLKAVRVNAGETALEFYTPTDLNGIYGGSGTIGSNVDIDNAYRVSFAGDYEDHQFSVSGAQGTVSINVDSETITAALHIEAGGASSLLQVGTGLAVNSSNVVRFNNAYSFPTATGTLGQVLEVDGSGNLVFATPSGGSDGNGMFDVANNGGAIAITSATSANDLTFDMGANTFIVENQGVALDIYRSQFGVGFTTLIDWTMNNDLSVKKSFARTYAVTVDDTAGSEEGAFKMSLIDNGVLNPASSADWDFRANGVLEVSQNQKMVMHRQFASAGGLVSLELSLSNSAQERVSYAALTGRSITNTDGVEDGAMVFQTMENGSLAEQMRLNEAGRLTLGGVFTASATAHIKGETSDSSTTVLTAENFAGTDILTVRNDVRVGVNKSAPSALLSLKNTSLATVFDITSINSASVLFKVQETSGYGAMTIANATNNGNIVIRGGNNTDSNFNTGGKFIVGSTAGTSTLSVIGADGKNRPVVEMRQEDLGESFFELYSESTTDNSQPLVDAVDLTTPGSIVGWFKVKVTDTQGTNPIADGTYYVPFYTTPTA